MGLQMEQETETDWCWSWGEMTGFQNPPSSTFSDCLELEGWESFGVLAPVPRFLGGPRPF